MTRKDSNILDKNVETLLETGGEAPKLADTARARIRTELIAAHGTVQPTKRPAFAIGAGLVGAAAIAMIALHFVGGDPKGTHIQSPSSGHTDDVSWLTDPSGGSVTLLGPRHARVEGAALVDVTPGKGKFTVDTARGTIEVIGTRFFVDAEAERTTAAVVRGEVKLATSAGDVVLHAGEQGVAESGKAPTRGPAPRLSHLVSWAAEARRKDDHDAAPVHHGTLFARDPGVRSHPPWGQEYPLPLAKLAVDVVVDHQVARIALDQTFHNDADQDLEGVYRFAIPPDAALQRLAMYVNGNLMESAVVERMQGRRIYEELVYRRVDPALLEWAGTGRLNLRVYPLPAHEDKRLMLAYTQSLPKLYDDWSLTVPLPEIDQPVGELDLAVRVRDCHGCEVTSTSHQITVNQDGDDAVVSYKQQAVKTGDSLVLHVRDNRREPTIVTKRDGDDRYLMVRAPAALDRGETRPYHARSWVILDDVSASRGPTERRAQADMIDSLMRELDENDRVSVVAFDVTARQKLALTRVVDVDRRAVKSALAEEGGVGATDFKVALDAALGALAGVAPADAMIVYLGDGVITAGPRHLDELREKIVGKARFVGVGIGDGPDTQTLGALASATGGYTTTIDLADDVSWRTFDLVAALHTTRVTGLDAKLVDASGQLVPATVYLASPQLADGEEVELVAKLAGTGQVAAVDLVGTLDGQPWGRRIQVGKGAQDGEFLPRMWAQRHIAARLLAKHEPVESPCARSTWAGPCASEAEVRAQRDEAIRKDVVALGTRYFLLSRHTSLLVLENDDMYRQFNVTKGKGETWAPYKMPDTIAVNKSQPPNGTIAVSTTTPWGDIPDDGEMLRAPIETSLAPPMALRAQLAFREAGNDLWRQPVGGVQTETGGDLAGGTAGPFVVPVSGEMTLDEGRMGKRDARWDNGLFVDDHTIVTNAVFARDLDDLQGSTAGGFGYGRNGGRWGWMPYGYPANPAFADITAFVPALVADDNDAWRRELQAGSGAHTIDPAARDLLTAAREHLPTGVYRWNELEIAVDDQHRFGWRRTTDAGLDETASFDGATWTRRYTELGLDVTRSVGDDDIAVALAYLPVWIAKPEHYAKWFDVTASGRRVTLSRTVGGKVTTSFTIDFDDHDRVVAIKDGAGKLLVDIAYAPTGPFAAHVRGDRVQVGFTPQAIADATRWAHSPTPSPVVVELPGHVPAYWRTKLITALPGTPVWRQLQRHLMVSLAATHNYPDLARAYEQLLASGGVELGDLAIASAGVVTATADAKLRADVAPLPAGSPLVRYLLAPRGDHARAAVTTGLVGALWLLRDAAADLAAQRPTTAIDRVLAIDARATRIRGFGASMLAQHYELKADDIARVLDVLATGPLRNVVRAEAAMLFYSRGQHDAAADRVATLVADLDLDAAPARLDWAGATFGGSRRGAAGWELVWASWRDRVLAGTSFPHVAELLRAANQHPADLSAIVAKAVALAGDDVDRQLQVAATAMSFGQPTLAQSIVESLVRKSPSRTAYQVLGRLQLQQGRQAEALASLVAAQDAGANDKIAIATVRSELAQIIEVARQLAIASSGSARDAAVATAMRWGSRWRDVDPGNPQIDQVLGALQLAVGNKDEAWRQLSSVIERNPMSGDGYQIVASAYERQGRVTDALDYWHMAIVIDQTNPTPRLRRAQALIALGRNADGDAQLQEIVDDRRWHNVWSGVVEQARGLLARGKQRLP